MVEQQQETEGNSGSRLRRRGTVAALGTVGVAGILGGLVAGAGVFASAATTTTFGSDLSVCANPSAPVPGTPLYQKRFTVGSGKVSGTIPAITSAQLTTLGITPTLVSVTVTTQYNSGRSGADKTDVATVNLPGHQYQNPLLFNIPPVTNSTVVGSGAVNYSAVTTGKAFATVTVDEYVAQATSNTPAIVAGTVCPTGTTLIGNLQTNVATRPATPTNVTATPGGNATTTTAGTAPNNGAATVKFTPSVNNGSQVDGYGVLPIDLTSPTTVQEPEVFVAPTTTTDTGQRTAYVTGLVTGHSYQFQVFAISNLDFPSTLTSATTPAVTAVAATVTSATSSNALARRSTVK